MKFLKQILPYLWSHKRITAAILVVIVAGYIVYPKPKPTVPAQKATYQTFTQSLSVSGVIVAKNSVNLTFPISGRLAYVGVKKGDYVWEGQTLATIDQQIAQKNLQAALISYSLTRNSFNQVQNTNQNRTPDEALNDDMKRILQNNQYNLDQAVNSVELQDLAKKQAVLWTPISGIVTRSDAEMAGPDALAGSTTFTVTDPQSLAFDMDVDQADISKVQVGQKVQIVLDSFPLTTLTEKITRIDFVSHTTSNGGSAFIVEVHISQEDNEKYKIGMSGNATIIVSQKEHTLTVPLSSLVNDSYVWVKTKKGFIKKSVTLGQESDTDAEVVKGVSEGDIIALDPTLAAKQQAK